MLAVKAQNWSESAQRFLKQCADAGNVEACYTLGMVSIYISYHLVNYYYIYLYIYNN